MTRGITKNLVGLLVAACAFLGLYLWGQQGYSLAREGALKLKVTQVQLETTQEALRLSEANAALNRTLAEKRLKELEAQRTAAQRREKELSNALKDNPDWAAQPVPDSVWDALGPQGSKAAP